jgi:hypothetical protein
MAIDVLVPKNPMVGSFVDCCARAADQREELAAFCMTGKEHC